MNGVSNAADIDFLFGQIKSASPAYRWSSDLNVDGTVNNADVDVLVKVLFSTQYGDTDLNHAVNFDDLLALAKHYNAPGTWATGDFDGSGTVGFDDLLTLAKNYNFTSAALGGTSDLAGFSPDLAGDWALAQALLPEPTSLLSIAGIARMVCRRRRRVQKTA